MKYVLQAAVLVLVCAVLSALFEAIWYESECAATGCFDLVVLWFLILWLLMAEIPAWLICAAIPLLVAVALFGRLGKRFNNYAVFAVTGVLLGIALSFPISVVVPNFMIAVGDDGTGTDLARWLVQAPQLVASSVIAWIAFGYLYRKDAPPKDRDAAKAS